MEEFRSSDNDISEEKGDGSTKLNSDIRQINSINRLRRRNPEGSRNIIDISEIDRSRNDGSE